VVTDNYYNITNAYWLSSQIRSQNRKKIFLLLEFRKKYLGRANFSGSVGKGKHLIFYFWPHLKIHSLMMGVLLSQCWPKLSNYSWLALPRLLLSRFCVTSKLSLFIYYNNNVYVDFFTSTIPIHLLGSLRAIYCFYTLLTLNE